MFPVLICLSRPRIHVEFVFQTSPVQAVLQSQAHARFPSFRASHALIYSHSVPVNSAHVDEDGIKNNLCSTKMGTIRGGLLPFRGVARVTWQLSAQRWTRCTLGQKTVSLSLAFTTNYTENFDGFSKGFHTIGLLCRAGH